MCNIEIYITGKAKASATSHRKLGVEQPTRKFLSARVHLNLQKQNFGLPLSFPLLTLPLFYPSILSYILIPFLYFLKKNEWWIWFGVRAGGYLLSTLSCLFVTKSFSPKVLSLKIYSAYKHLKTM